MSITSSQNIYVKNSQNYFLIQLLPKQITIPAQSYVNIHYELKSEYPILLKQISFRSTIRIEEIFYKIGYLSVNELLLYDEGIPFNHFNEMDKWNLIYIFPINNIIHSDGIYGQKFNFTIQITNETSSNKQTDIQIFVAGENCESQKIIFSSEYTQ
ncbi:MAG: hypothetical protein ACUVQP_08845 [Bacteroidales bacterium]